MLWHVVALIGRIFRFHLFCENQNHSRASKLLQFCCFFVITHLCSYVLFGENIHVSTLKTRWMEHQTYCTHRFVCHSLDLYSQWGVWQLFSHKSHQVAFVLISLLSLLLLFFIYSRTNLCLPIKLRGTFLRDYKHQILTYTKIVFVANFGYARWLYIKCTIFDRASDFWLI